MDKITVEQLVKALETFVKEQDKVFIYIDEIQQKDLEIFAEILNRPKTFDYEVKQA